MRAGLLAGALLGLLLGPAADLGAQEGEETTLRVLVHPPWFDGFSYLEQTARRFEAAHPGVRVEVLSSAGATGEEDKLKFMLAGGLPVDVTWIDVTEFAAFLNGEVLLDLQPYFDADPTWDPDAYFPQILDAMRDERGHLYGLASTFTPYVMYVNLSLLEREGIPRPPDDWSWADLERIARAVTREVPTESGGTARQYGISITQWLQALAPWIWQNGGRFLDENGRCALDEPEAVEALEFLVRLLREEQLASDDATYESLISQGLFMSGRCAFYGPIGYWETYRFKEIEAFEWDVMPLPRRKEAATSVAMRFYVVPRIAPHPELAYAFVRALASDTMQSGLAEIGNGVPGLIRAAESEAFLKPDVSPEREQVYLDVLEHARFMPVHTNWREVEKQTKAVLEEALILGTATAREACERAAVMADEVIAREEDLRDRPELAGGWFVAAWALPAAAFAGLLAWILRRRRGRILDREERSAWRFLAPWALGFVFLLAGPALVSALLSLSEWSPLRELSHARWMGLDQYRRLAGDPTFHDSLRVTLVYALVSVPLQLALALGLALLLDKRFRGVGALRTLFYLPTVVSPVILGAVWRWILEEEGGLLNRSLASAGVPGPDWLGNARTVLPAFVIMSLWIVGAQMLVFLAGLQGVDRRLHEAARIDGAGAWSRFRHVTLPSISPVLLFNLIVGLIQSFQLFAQPYVMTQGGPGNESRFLVLYLYEQGFRFLHMGYASTLAWVLFALVLVLSLVVLRSSKRWVHYAGGAR